ncbi:MAG TPA: hypothetical protein DEO99_06710 [Bacteroidetes bacterium]|nr:hypothetical protein [Bacteroidota bacterium]
MWWSCSNYASISTCIEHAAQQWGSSPRNSYRLLLRAWPQVREDVKATLFDRQDKTYWIIHQLMTAAGEVVKKNTQASLLVPVVSLTRCLGWVSTAQKWDVWAGDANLTHCALRLHASELQNF